MKINGLFYLVFTAMLLLIPSCTSDVTGNKIYVANEGDGTISVIDENSLRVVRVIKLDGMPHNVNIDPLGNYIYATNHEGEEENENEGMHHTPYLRVIDAKSNKVKKSVPMEQMAAHVVPSKKEEEGNLVYVSIEGSNKIVEVDVIAGQILREFIVGEGPHGFVLSNNGKTIYAPNMRTNDISIVDIGSGKEERLVLELNGKKCETPVAMGITSDDKYSFVTCGKSFEIYKIDNTAKKIIARIELNKGEFPGPIQVPVHPSENYLYVPDMRNGVVHKISIDKFEVLKDIPAGAGAHGIAYSSDGKKAYVTNTWENTLAVLDLEKDAVVKKIDVGSKPNGVALTSGKNQGW